MPVGSAMDLVCTGSFWVARMQRDPPTGTVQEVDIRSRFEATGVVRLDSAFTADQAAAMRNAMWQHAEGQAGLRPADPASWAGSPVLNWQGLSRDPVFGPLVDNRAVGGALEAILGAGGRRPGAQILFSLPEPGPVVLPDSWHIDCGFDHVASPVPVVKLFAFVGEVGPRGGGTMVVSGTHRLVDRYRMLRRRWWVPARKLACVHVSLSVVGSSSRRGRSSGPRPAAGR